MILTVANALREQCQREVLAAFEKHDWQLVDSTDEFVLEVMREVEARRSPEAIRLAVVRCYGAVLYAACCGQDSARRNRAFQELGAYVHPIVWKRLHRREHVADALQQVLLKVWQQRQQCREPYSFLHWVAMITLNVCRDVSRELFIRNVANGESSWELRVASQSDMAHDQNGRLERESLERARPLSPPSARLDDQAIRRRLIEAIELCVVGSEAQRRVIIETFLNDRSVKEIADLLNVKAENVFVLRSRALKTLRACEEFVRVLEDWLELNEGI